MAKTVSAYTSFRSTTIYFPIFSYKKVISNATPAFFIFMKSMNIINIPCFMLGMMKYKGSSFISITKRSKG
uniref:Uncharacterized protein n=1 Tax=Clostridium botulinum TaxID=1491 RepID=C4IXF5_CLOBO|nr:hypothetical protein [Clostridium botulinum]